MPPIELTTREVAKLLGYTDSSFVLRMVKAGRLKPIRKFPGASGGYLFRKSEVDRFIRAKETKP